MYWKELKQKRRLPKVKDSGRVNMTFCSHNVYQHFVSNVQELVYPEKTIFVAICYSYWISKLIDCPLLYILSDGDLLADDPFFVPYKKDYIVDYTKENPTLEDITMDSYKYILNKDLSALMNIKNTTVEATYEYFKAEYL